MAKISCSGSFFTARGVQGSSVLSGNTNNALSICNIGMLSVLGTLSGNVLHLHFYSLNCCFSWGCGSDHMIKYILCLNVQNKEGGMFARVSRAAFQVFLYNLTVAYEPAVAGFTGKETWLNMQQH